MGYNRLQCLWVTTGYGELQQVMVGYNRLQCVTTGYSRLQWATNSNPVVCPYSPSSLIVFVMPCDTVCMCLWGVDLQICPLVQPSKIDNEQIQWVQWLKKKLQWFTQVTVGYSGLQYVTVSYNRLQWFPVVTHGNPL